MKYLCNFAVSAAMLSLAVLMSSCQRSQVEEYTNVQSQPQLVPQEEKKETAVPAVQKAEVPAKKAEPAAVQKAEVPAKKAEPAAVQKAEVPAKKAEPAAVQKAEVPAKKAEPAAKKTAAVRKAAVKLPCKHTVRSSDNLWRISMHYYGKGSYWKHIYNANKKVIRKPEFLEPGTVLTIPAVKKGK